MNRGKNPWALGNSPAETERRQVKEDEGEWGAVGAEGLLSVGWQLLGPGRRGLSVGPDLEQLH